MHSYYGSNFPDQQHNTMQGYTQNQTRALPKPPTGNPICPPPGTLPKPPSSPFPRPAQAPPAIGSPPGKRLIQQAPQPPHHNLTPRALPPHQRSPGGTGSPALPARSPEQPMSTSNPAPVMPFSPFGAPPQEPIANTSNPTPVLPFSQLRKDDSPTQIAAPQFSLSSSSGSVGLTFGGFKPIGAGQGSASSAPLSSSISFGTFRTSPSAPADHTQNVAAPPQRKQPPTQCSSRVQPPPAKTLSFICLLFHLLLFYCYSLICGAL